MFKPFREVLIIAIRKKGNFSACHNMRRTFLNKICSESRFYLLNEICLRVEGASHLTKRDLFPRVDSIRLTRFIYG